MKYIKHKHSLIIFIFILLFSYNAIIISTNAQDEEILSLTISRNLGVGVDSGNKIEGDFTITGSGPENILNLTLLFNGTQESFESSNQLTFRFETKDYPLGLMNITLIGEDSEGNIYIKSIFKEFISEEIGNWILIIVGLIVLLSVGLKLGSYMKKKQKGKQSAIEKKNKIHIDIDKEFR